MRILFKITQRLRERVLQNLARPHAFAAERVGFISCRVGALADQGIILLAQDYHPVDDADYLDDPTVGARMGSAAIRKALQFAYNHNVSMFHVHCHDHVGQPGFSYVDLTESARFVPDFFNVRPTLPHGALVLSQDSATGLCWCPSVPKPEPLGEVAFVGVPMQFIRTL